MKLGVIYYSKTGHTKEMAEWIARGMRAIEGIEAEVFDIEEIDVEYINECKGVVVGTPTYTADICWQLKKWLDEPSKCKLSGKLGGAFSTAKYAQGGADIAISTIINHLLVHGMLVYSGGCSYGQPFIHLGPVALQENYENSKSLFSVFGERFARKAVETFSK